MTSAGSAPKNVGVTVNPWPGATVIDSEMWWPSKRHAHGTVSLGSPNSVTL